MNNEYPKAGDRVCAFPLSTHRDEHHIYIYGFGVYEADAVSPISIDYDEEEMFGPLSTNPMIRLDDNRGIIWGYECFFTFEEVVRVESQGKEIVLLDIAVKREKWARENIIDN